MSSLQVPFLAVFFGPNLVVASLFRLQHNPHLFGVAISQESGLLHSIVGVSTS